MSTAVQIMRLVFLLMFLTVVNSVAQAMDHPCARGSLVSGKIDTVGPGNQFTLAGSNKKFSLANVVMMGHPSFPQNESRDIRLHLPTKKPDRYGRFSAHGFSGKRWIQGELLARGHALLSGSGGNLACLRAMREQENNAHLAKTGLWRSGKFEISALELEKLDQKRGYFVLVVGKILSIGDRSRRLYLNFGKKWSQDFTVSVVKKGSGAFNGSIERLTGSRGKTVRVRGILEERQGPLIRLIDEAQIEIIE